MTILRNTIEVFNRTLKQAEVRISELKHRSFEIILSEEQNESITKKSVERL